MIIPYPVYCVSIRIVHRVQVINKLIREINNLHVYMSNVKESTCVLISLQLMSSVVVCELE